MLTAMVGLGLAGFVSGVNPAYGADTAVTVKASARTLVPNGASPDKYGFRSLAQVVLFDFSVTNTTGATITTPSTMDITGPTGASNGPVPLTCAATSVVPGGSTTCQGSYQGTQADLDNAASVVSPRLTGSTTIAGVTATASVATSPVKTLTVKPAFTSAGAIAPVTGPAGTQVFYRGTINNPLGGVTQTDITVTSSLPGAVVDCPSSTLTAGQSMQCTISYTVTDSDLTAGSISQSVTVTSNDPTGVSHPLSTQSPVVVPAGLSVLGADVDLPFDAAPGSQATLGYTVTNIGGVTLTNVALGVIGEPNAVFESCAATTLSPGQSTTCTAIYTVQSHDAATHAYPVIRVDAMGAVSGAANGNGVTVKSDSSPVLPYGYAVVQVPQLDTSNPPNVRIPAFTYLCEDGAQNSCRVGGSATLIAVFANTSASSASDVHLTGTVQPSGVEPDWTCTPGDGATLAAGDVMVCTAPYTFTDVDAAQTPPAAVMSAGFSVGGGSPSLDNLSLNLHENIYLQMVPSSGYAGVAGAATTFGMEVENIGATPVTDISMSVANTLDGSEISSVVCPSETLQPWQLMGCTAFGRISPADVVAAASLSPSSVILNPTMTYAYMSSDNQSRTGTQQILIPAYYIHMADAPSLSLTKSASLSEVAAAGKTVTYTYTVTNTTSGQAAETLYGILVDDFGAGSSTPDATTVGFTGQGDLSAITCTGQTNGQITLAAGASITCTATYTTLVDDLAPGITALDNTASATGFSPADVPVVAYASASVAVIHHTVHFEANTDHPHTGSMANQVSDAWGDVILAANAFDTPGFTFHGWSTCPGGGVTPTEVVDGQTITCEAIADQATLTDLTQDVTLYAQWGILVPAGAQVSDAKPTAGILIGVGLFVLALAGTGLIRLSRRA